MERTRIGTLFLVWLFAETAWCGTDAFDLLSQYAERQNRLRSFVIKSEIYRESRIWYEEKARKKVEVSETAFDGRRICVRTRLHHDEVALDPDEAYYLISTLWDANSYISYKRPPKSVGNVYIKERKPWKDRDYLALSNDNFLWGYLGGDGKRVDAVLREAETMSVRQEQEDVGGSPCYVIEARTPAGRYILWIDAHHGYNIARAEVRRSEGDLYIGKVLSKTRNFFFSLRNVRFEKVDGLWMPVEGDAVEETTWGQRYYYKWKSHVKRTEVILNPDHDALSSFALDDIKDGAHVRVADAFGIEYAWQRGELVARINEDTITTIDEITGRLRTEERRLDSDANNQTAEAGGKREGKSAKPHQPPNDSGGFCRPPGPMFLSREREQAALSVSVLPAVIPVGVLVPVVGGIAWLTLRRRKEVSDEIR